MADHGDGSDQSRKRRGSFSAFSDTSGSPPSSPSRGGTPFPALPSSSPRPTDTPAPEPKRVKVEPRSSSRLQTKSAEKMDRLRELAGDTGTTKTDPALDITPHFMLPLDDGADGRGYVSKEARRAIERQMGATTTKFPSLEESNVPKLGLQMRAQAKKEGKGSLHVSTRHRSTGFKVGDDQTYTENVGHGVEKRLPSDTPAPRSPKPDRTRSALSLSMRSEQAHQSPFQFTKAPGTTVHAPTQANQVADSGLERFIKDRPGGFIHREDTFTHSRLTGARPTKDGQWETQRVEYRRRRSPTPERSPSPEPHDRASRSPSPDSRRLSPMPSGSKGGSGGQGGGNKL